jgi:hypothetical protein
MVKLNIREVLRLAVLGAVWAMLVYSLLFGGFSPSLADYGADLTCAKVRCGSLAGCGTSGTVEGCKLFCAGGGAIQCPPQ